MQLVRLCICCVLAWYGGLYLVHTPGIGDLILNAVALEIVLQIDELIFAALGSWRLKRLVGATALPACVPSYAVLAPPILGAFAFRPVWKSARASGAPCHRAGVASMAWGLT